MTTTAAASLTDAASLLELKFGVLLKLSYQPGAERRFSFHIYMSKRLQAVAVRKASSSGHSCHHRSPAVHIVHMPEVMALGNSNGVPVMVASSDAGGDASTACGILSLHVNLDGLRWRLGSSATTEALLESTLSIDVFDHISNQSGEDCMNQAGCVRIPFVHLMARQNTTTLLRYAMGVPGMRVKHYNKGVLCVKPAEPARISLRNQPTVVELRDPTQLEAVAQRALSINLELFEEQMGRWIEFFDRQVTTRFECTNGINVWRYDSRVGPEPFEAYIAAPLPEPNLRYYEQALQIVLARYNLSTSRWMAEADLDSPRRSNMAERILCEVVTLFVCVCNYVPDMLYANASNIGKSKGKRVVLTTELIESFDFCRVRRALDCEDSALEITWQCLELCKLYREQYAQMTPALRRLVEVCHMFYPTLWLVGVSGAQINEEKMADVKEMDAHMHVALVPKAMWLEWCQRGGIVVDQTTMPTASEEWGDSEQALARSRLCHGVMINEGTGFLEPTGEDDTLDMRTILYKILGDAAGSAFDLARKVYGFKRGAPSGFYKLVVGIYTPAFLLRGGTACGFVPCYRDDLSKYVVRFQDATADRERQVVAVRMLPAISRAAWQEIQRVSGDLYPVGPLEHACLHDTSRDASWVQVARSNVEVMSRSLRRLVVPSTTTMPTTTTTTVAEETRVPVVYYIKYEACTGDALKALVDAASRLFSTAAPSTSAITRGPRDPSREVVIEVVSGGGGAESSSLDEVTQRNNVVFRFVLDAVDVREERVSPDLGAFRVVLWARPIRVANA